MVPFGEWQSWSFSGVRAFSDAVGARSPASRCGRTYPAHVGASATQAVNPPVHERDATTHH